MPENSLGGPEFYMKTSEAASETSFRFGPFRLDPARRMLLRDGERIALPAKSFETLLVLVEHHGKVVARETLFAR